jgi:hypothetical protein
MDSFSLTTKKRFWIAVGGAPLLILATALIAPALDPSANFLRALLVGYWLVALWFVLSAPTSSISRQSAVRTLSSGLGVTLALALAFAATFAASLLLVYLGV